MDRALDKALYGQVLEGKGPWPQGPIIIYKRKLREKWHDATYGSNTKCSMRRCPVCKKDYKLLI